jgi:hypothetical protein
LDQDIVSAAGYSASCVATGNAPFDNYTIEGENDSIAIIFTTDAISNDGLVASTEDSLFRISRKDTVEYGYIWNNIDEYASPRSS